MNPVSEKGKQMFFFEMLKFSDSTFTFSNITMFDVQSSVRNLPDSVW